MSKHNSRIENHEQEKGVQRNAPRSIHFVKMFSPKPPAETVGKPHESKQVIKINSTAEVHACEFKRLPASVFQRRGVAPVMIEVKRGGDVSEEQYASNEPNQTRGSARTLTCLKDKRRGPAKQRQPDRRPCDEYPGVH